MISKFSLWYFLARKFLDVWYNGCFNFFYSFSLQKLFITKYQNAIVEDCGGGSEGVPEMKLRISHGARNPSDEANSRVMLDMEPVATNDVVEF